MNNFQLYQILNIVANKDVKSNFLPPAEFNLELKKANIWALRDRLGLPERYQPGTFIAGSGASRVIDSDLAPVGEMKEVSVLQQETQNLSDWYYIDDFYTSTSVFPEIISRQMLGTRLNSPRKRPTEKYPVAIIVNSGLKIWPDTISKVTVVYYKRPTEPVFKTTVDATTGDLIYNPNKSVEMIWNDEMKLDVLHFIMQDVGVNIEKPDLQQLAQKYVEGGR